MSTPSFTLSRDHIEAYGRFVSFFKTNHRTIFRHSEDWQAHARRLYPVSSCALDGIEPPYWPRGA
jgi:hypothetical protein